MGGETAWKEYDGQSITGFVYDDENEELEIYFDDGSGWVGYGLPKYVGNYLSEIAKDLDKQIGLGDELAEAADDIRRVCLYLKVEDHIEAKEPMRVLLAAIDRYKTDRKESRKHGKKKTIQAKTEKNAGE